MFYRVGDWHEAADWVSSPEQVEEVRKNIAEKFAEDMEQGIVFSPIEYHLLDVGDSRVPDPPAGSSKYIRMLRGSAKIVALVNSDSESILNDLDPKDLLKLREMTQKIWRKTNPKERPLKDKELDMVISRHGEDVIERMLRE